MSDFATFALVIPTLNEAGNIRTVLQRVCEALSATDCDWEVVVVDDCSDDGTARIVQEFAKTNPRVRLVSRRAERGLAGAITYGWSHTEAELLGVIDADLQHPPEILPLLIEEIRNGADIAIASRYLQPHSMDGWNPARKFLSRVSVAASVIVQRRQLRVQDPLSGFFALRRDSVRGLEFQKTGFKLLLEILARARITTVREVPFTFSPRVCDQSKANWKTGADYISLLLSLLRDRAVRTRT